MTFALTGWMLYTLWTVLALMGLDVLAGLYRGLVSKSLSLTKLTGYLGKMLSQVLPLYILAGLTAADPTGWLALIAYYVAGVALVLQYLRDIKNKLWS